MILSSTWPLNAPPVPRRTPTAQPAPLGALSAIPVAPVIALGSGLTALGVLRSLHSSDISVYSICPAGDLVTRSRWYRPLPQVAGACPDPSGLPDFLSRLPLRNAVLIPCSDDWARAVAQLPPAIKRRFPASVPEAAVIDAMTDKWLFASLMESLDVPRPRTIRADSMGHLDSIPEDCFENSFLKPIDSQEFSRIHNAKAFQLRDKQHALEIMRVVADEGGSGFPILLQEYIPGTCKDGYLLDGFIDRSGVIRALIPRQRLAQYPPRFGNSARSHTIPVERVASALTSLESIFRATRYRGIFDAEFKFDHRDGLFKILEINARPWWFIEFATRCNTDLCKMAYMDALGLPVQAAPAYPLGRCCIHVNYDMAAHLAGDTRLSQIARWLWSLREVDEDILYRWDDPWPGFWASFSTLSHYRSHNRRGAADTRIVVDSVGPSSAPGP